MASRPELPPTDALAPGDGVALPSSIRLVVLSGPDQGKEILLSRGTYYVGKAPECELVLTDGTASRRHLELSVRREGVVVKDLGSKNGSFFENARFKEVTVRTGALITIGSTELKLTALGDGERLPPSDADHFGGLRGRSLAMRNVYAVLERVAPTEAAVLIEGETGTGKELCAHALHMASARRDGPFVVCDLAAVSRRLIESELFGYKRGAFTGAERDHEGVFAQAHGGTLFLDEVGELELEFQPRLLRAIQEHQVKPLGGSAYRQFDVRVIAATNQNLREKCQTGQFREDLYHRLAIVRVHLPALRERKDDIPALVRHFLEGAQVQISDDARALLSEYDWPGNVREFRNVLERAASLVRSGEVLTSKLLGLDMPAAADEATKSAPPDRYRLAKQRLLAEWERVYVAELLQRAGGNVSEAARQGGIGRPLLYRLMKKHGLGTFDPSEGE